MNRLEQITFLLEHPDELVKKKPFFRGASSFSVNDPTNGQDYNVNNTQAATLPNVYKTIVSQDRFMMELDPDSHDIMFDDNLPSICVKLNDNNFREIKWKRLPLPLQKRILEKQVLVLCGYPVEFTLQNGNPTDKEMANYHAFKNAWKRRNQDGMRTKAVYAQKSLGDCALLYYMDYKGRIKSRLLTYADGYQIISHNDENGDRLLDVIYYQDCNNIIHMDCYDDTYLYSFVSGMEGVNGWQMRKERHGFSESPVATKRGDVAWNNVQDLIEAYEIVYNIFLVIQKRHGWGILYIKGKFSENAKKIAGSIILNDTSVDGNGSAEFKSPPKPDGILDSLKSLFNQIQIGSSTTFLLPEDIRTGGDISGLAVMLTQSLDIEGGSLSIIDWQNFADKCCRLFKEGFSKELVNTGANPMAFTEFAKMEISASYKLWRPFSVAEYNQMLSTMVGAGLLSKKTAIELNTESRPDELARIMKEEEDRDKKELERLDRETKANQANQTAEQNIETKTNEEGAVQE
ncbi:MAG: phage portal protein [Bacteroidaceae bacterium]|nr:phage portal protein [Bacteroidaceae bacterium]